jgi:hypothetical protein
MMQKENRDDRVEFARRRAALLEAGVGYAQPVSICARLLHRRRRQIHTNQLPHVRREQ